MFCFPTNFPAPPNITADLFNMSASREFEGTSKKLPANDAAAGWSKGYISLVVCIVLRRAASDR